MKSLIARFLTAGPLRPVFAEDEDLSRAMRIAELKWLLSEIAEPRSGSGCACGWSEDAAWQA
jgi:hypothetical protein